MQTKPTSEAYREGWDAMFRRSTVEVNLRPGDTMSRLQVGGIVPKPREQYEREAEALEAQQSPEPPLPDGWHLDERGDLRGPGWVVSLTPWPPYHHTDSEAIIVEDTMGGPGPIPWPVIRWLAWKAGVKV